MTVVPLAVPMNWHLQRPEDMPFWGSQVTSSMISQHDFLYENLRNIEKSSESIVLARRSRISGFVTHATRYGGKSKAIKQDSPLWNF